MNKIIIVALFLLAFSPLEANAQTLTRTDIATIGPRLIIALDSVKRTYPNIVNSQIAAQNALIANYSINLRNMSQTLAAGNPSQVQIEIMSKTLRDMSTEIGKIVIWRSGVSSTTATMINIVSNIRNIISQAV